MRPFTFAVLAALSLLACDRRLTPAQRTVDEQVLRDRVANWGRHLNNKSVDSLAAFYQPSDDLVTVWPDGHRAMGWSEEERSLRQLVADVATLNLVLQEPIINVLGRETAVIMFRYSMDEILVSGGRDVFSGHGTQVWTRGNGDRAWRIVASHLSRTPVGATAQPMRRP